MGAVSNEASAQAISDLHHPEATLRVVRQELSSPTPSNNQLARLHRLLRQVPSFPFTNARYSLPITTRAVSRIRPLSINPSSSPSIAFPPMGGFTSRTESGYSRPAPTWRLGRRSTKVSLEPLDPLDLAKSYLRTAAQLEPALTDRVLAAAERYQVPPNRWGDLVPGNDLGRNTLLSSLFGSKHDAEAFTLLREMLVTSQDLRFFRQATQWALQRGQARLGLEAALKWQDATAYQSFRSALKQIEKASGVSSRASLELLCSMGNEYLNRGDIVLAESLFAEASTLSPSYAPATLGLAKISRRSGNNEQAIAQYQRVLRVDPNNAEAERELARLVTTTNLWNESSPFLVETLHGSRLSDLLLRYG